MKIKKFTILMAALAVIYMPARTVFAAAPVLSDIPSQTINEGGTFASINLDDYVTDDSTSDADIVWTYSGDSALMVSIVSRVATITALDTDWNGFETITFTATDEELLTDSDDATFTINAVNDEPSFTKGANETILEDAGAQTVNGWATGISAGPANESGQTLTFHVSNNNNSLFSVQPDVNASTGNLTYTPAANANGSATVSIYLTDNGGTANGGDDTSPTETFTITVTAVNDEPSFNAVSDPPAVNEDAGAQSVANFATGMSPGGGADEAAQVLTFNVTNNTNPSLFAVAPAITATGELTYTPADDANGSATITIELQDDGGVANGGDDTSPTQTFTITVNAVNDEPSFTKGADQSVNEDAGAQTVNGWATGISAGPANESGQTLTFHVSNNNNSLFSAQPDVNASGDLTYTPAANANGSATVSIYLTDNGGGVAPNDDTSPTQTFTITVNAVNDSPVATDDSYSVDEDNTLTVAVASGVLVNDSDPVEGDSLQAVLVTNVSNGSLTFNTDGSFTYVPNVNFNGIDSFTYQADDQQSENNLSNVATVSIDVDAVNDEPDFTAANPPAVDEDAGTQTIAGWATFDAGPPNEDSSQSVRSYNVSNISNAGLFSTPPAVDTAGTLTYTPAANAFGTSTFDLSVTDDGGTSNGGDDTSPTQTFTITVNSINDPPVATDDTYSVDEDNTLTVAVASGVLGNDSDPIEGDSLQAVLVTNVSNGSLTFNTDGSFTYVPNVNFNGIDSFTYQADDQQSENNLSNVATVSIDVDAVNDEPDFTAANPPAVDEDAGTQTIAGWATFDAGPPNEDSSQSVSSYNVSNISNAGLFSTPPAVDTAGTLTYTPAANAFGTSTFDLSVTDDGGTSNGGDDTSPTQTFTITVNSINDPPVATDDTYSVDEDNTLTVAVASGVLGNDSDPIEGDSLQAVLVTNVSNGSLTFNPDGSFTYVPNFNFNGIDSFTYQADDQQSENNLSNVATVSIDVDAVNDEPDFTAANPPAVDEDAGTQTIAGWATFDAGPPNEDSSQSVSSYNVSNISNAGLFSTPPAVDTAGTLTYTPAANAFGTSTFDLSVTDDGGTSNGGDDTSPTQTFTITVNSINDPPVATDDTYSVDEDNTLTVAVASGVLSNDDDSHGGAPGEENTALTATLVTDVSSGSLTLNNDGSFTYTPNGDFNGTDTFTYTATDNLGGVSNTATVTIGINSINDAPVAHFSGAPTSGAVPLTVVFTDNSTDVDIGDSIVSWSWDFGDGFGDTVQNPTHDYTLAGTYTVTLTVTDIAGATDDETKTNYITSLWTLTIYKTGTGASVSTATAGAGSDPGLCPGGTAPTAPTTAMYLYKNGDIVTLTAIDKAPPSGSEFQVWTGDVANTSAASTTTTMNGDKTVTADFIGKYSIISIQRTGGTITPLGERFVYDGANQAYSISTNGGYTNSDVVVDGSSQGPLDAYTFSNITTDHEIIAVFIAGDVPYTPPQAGDDQIYKASVPPLVMLIMGRNHKLYYEAYNDASDLNEDGTLDVGYNPNIDYYGYFDSYKVYTYDSTDQRFEPVRTTTDKKTSGNPADGEWGGDFLNYLTMTRMDTLRKVLYGGDRSTDTASETVLQRVYVPQDAHSWGKEYKDVATDGYDIRDYAPFALPNADTRHLFGSTTLSANGDPLLRVLQNNSHRIWEWASKEGGACDSSLGTPADYVVKVLVGVSSMPEVNCKQYPDGAYKPIGILQKHGEAGRMYFGLLTGSYAKNTSGGVLRKRIGPITDEINPDTGQFITPAGGNIIDTINKFRVSEYSYGHIAYEPGWPGAWVTTRPMSEGEFPDWGNPIAEMMYEGLRYYAGKATPTTDFHSSTMTEDDALGLPNASWDDPYATHDYCAKPFMLVLSDINPTYDSDQLPGSYFGSAPSPNDLPTLVVDTIADTIFSAEGLTGSYYIGQEQSNYDGSCAPKAALSFGDLRGLCPEEPTKQGSYYSASVANFGLTQDINPVEGDQNVLTYAVALASPLPKIEVPIGDNTITLVPFAKSVGGCLGIVGTEGVFQPTNTIVDFYVETIAADYGKFRINFEDVEQAADHDMDAIVEYEYQVNVDNTVDITLTSTHASGCIIQHVGYIISGTTEDGTYLEVRDEDTGSGSDSDYFLDTPPGETPGGTWNDSVDLPLTTTRTFTVGTTTAAELLESPLWYAAKWGGFNDLDDDGTPNTQNEWDEDGDGVPDTYFYVVNPLKLEHQLNKTFTDILSRGVSHVAPVVSVDEANRTQSGDELYMAFFKPIPDAYWQGNLKKYGLEYLTRDDCGRTVPEWTVVDRNGDIAGDCEGKFYGSSDSYWSTNDGGYVDSGGAGGKLKDAIDDVSLASGPYYDFRNIYTYKGTIGNGSLVSFTNITNTDLEVSPEMRHKIINYVYGYTFDAEDATGYPTAKRDWVLGDIIHSEPKVIDYLDGDYALEYRFIAIGANDGMLHVFTDMACTIDGQSYDAGDEIFAFVPGDLLSNLQECASTDTHIYMVDGSATLLRAKTYDDANSDGLRNTGEYYDKTLVFGERRGGKSYWALDITKPDPSQWEVKWHIQGGTGGITTDMTKQIDELGFTWSKPRFARLRTAFDTVKYVAIFAGGYDPQEDGFPEGFEDSNANGAWDSGESQAVTVGGTEGYDKYNPDKNSMGRGIYVVDVDDGRLLFSATYDETDLTTGTDQTYSDMRYCFPADISVIPISETNLVMYAADIYGQIWKITYNYFGSEQWTVSLVFQSNPGSDLPTGDTDIGNAALNSNDTGRKTFYSPDVSYFGSCWTKKPVLYFGTGDRAHPRSTMISNRFYAVADYNGQPDVTKETDLLNLTCNELEDENMVDADNDGDIDGDDVTRQNNLKTILQTPSQCRGFYRVLDKQGNCSAESISHVGEHVLCTPTLFFGNVFFTSYQPVFDDPCNPEGNAFIYAIDYCWGTSVFNYNKNNDPSGNTNRDITDTYQKIAAGSIPSAVTIITRGGHPASLISAGGALVGAGEDLSTNIPGPPGGVSQMLWKTD